MLSKQEVVTRHLPSGGPHLVGCGSVDPGTGNGCGMEFFLMTEPQLGGTYQDLARATLGAEAAGLAGFARSDH